MKLMEIIQPQEQNHPFNYAYEPQRPADIAAIKSAYAWAAKAYKLNKVPPPVLIANHQHMQRAAAQANHNTKINGEIYGWYSQKYRSVFLSDRLQAGKRDKIAEAVLVHEFVHYLQHVSNKPNDVDALENEANEYMMRYMKSI